ncbi:MAG TPA: heterodisulfide reductase-related iron-sulfur binding cluster, partial [Nitrospirota bacterium]|nr:heterodisulfide reductase-related iron-sulfur binding cluster [Nitrospirota bacterium]
LELLRRIPGSKIEVIDRGCCGAAGCMGYTEDTFDLSMEIGSPMLEGIRESFPDIVVSDCPKCNLQIRQGTGLDSIHPIELLANCYVALDPVPLNSWPVTATIYNK